MHDEDIRREVQKERGGKLSDLWDEAERLGKERDALWIKVHALRTKAKELGEDACMYRSEANKMSLESDGLWNESHMLMGQILSLTKQATELQSKAFEAEMA